MDIDYELLKCLPPPIIQHIPKNIEINEIRIRKDRPLCFTSGGINISTGYLTTAEELELCITKLCKNSVYAYFEYIKNGYIPFDNGYRVGVCGTAVKENGKIINITDISSLNIRIPSNKAEIPKDFLMSLPYTKGTLVYSAPNMGKTTFLKAATAVIASPPLNKRVTVIDTKHELYSKNLHKNLPIDFYFGYPKQEGINMAVLTMSPEILVCDEIGINDDVSPLIECKNSGVALLCSVHASNLAELSAKECVRKLHSAGVFEAYVGIMPKDKSRTYTYTNRKDIKW